MHTQTKQNKSKHNINKALAQISKRVKDEYNERMDQLLATLQRKKKIK